MREIVIERSIEALDQLADFMGYEKPVGIAEKYYVAASKQSNTSQVQNVAFVKIDRDGRQDKTLNIVKKFQYDKHMSDAQLYSCQKTYYVAYLEQNGFQLVLPQEFAAEYFHGKTNPESHYTIRTNELAINALIRKGAVCRSIENIHAKFMTNEQLDTALKKLLTFETLLMRAVKKKEDRIVKTESKLYSRNDAVNVLVKELAKGICQLCDQQAPFDDESGNPFLESHHIIWRSLNGPDTIENTIALCPNCHRKMHVLALKEDIDKLQLIAERNYDFLLQTYPTVFLHLR